MLKEIRESRGMSQQDLATKSGINKRTIQAYEQGYRDIHGAKLSTLLSLANTMYCTLYEIVSDSVDQSVDGISDANKERIQ